MPNQDTMFIGLQKLIVKEHPPLLVEYLSVAMSHQDTVGTLAACVSHCKFLERAWKLEGIVANIQ
jgi:hypothetical protein